LGGFIERRYIPLDAVLLDFLCSFSPAMDKSIELRNTSVRDHTPNSEPYDHVERSGNASHNSDVEKLARLGKRQILKVCHHS
jgi:hypothetical protein